MTASLPSSCFDSLPDDVLVEIIKRIPQNFVHQYRCVSKRWLNITTSHSFIKSYIEYNTNKPPVALFYQHIATQYRSQSDEISSCAFSEDPLFKSAGFSLDFLRPSLSPNYNKMNIISWSNGLMLCSPDPTQPFCFYVCNPLTRHWVEIPPPPSNQLCCVGFVCMSTNNGCSFRIVWVSLQGSDEDYIKLQTYNSELKSWTESTLGNINKKVKFSRHKAAIECNGLLHFKILTGSIFVYDPYSGTNNGRFINVPDQWSSTIGACNGHIRYTRGFRDFCVWKLEDYVTEKWSLVQEFHLDEMETEIPEYLSNEVSSVEFHPSDENVIFLQLKGRILSCNMFSKKLTTLCWLASREDLLMFPITLPWWPVSLH